MSAYLVHRELRNANFEGKKKPTSITFPDSAYYSEVHIYLWEVAWISPPSFFWLPARVSHNLSERYLLFWVHLMLCSLSPKWAKSQHSSLYLLIPYYWLGSKCRFGDQKHCWEIVSETGKERLEKEWRFWLSMEINLTLDLCKKISCHPPFISWCMYSHKY